jgi:molecular chaperone HtpG
MSDAVNPQKHEFQTEVRELLQLMIHSLYRHPEIFLRELISNSADALDKVRFEGITNAELLGDDGDLRIDLHVDEEARTIVINDNGIGMNKEDLMGSLGTIASSGTRNFLKNLTGDSQKDMNLIGQFGVGFYSVFMVSENVEVLTRKAGEEEAWLWTSQGEGEFLLSEAEKSARGTTITIHLKDEEDIRGFASEWKVKEIVRKYSEFIVHPIWLTTKSKPAPVEEGQEPEVAEEKAPERLNEKTALWRRNPNEVTEENHKEFYQQISSDFSGEPATHTHSHLEGLQEFWSLVYIPSKAPFGLYQQERAHGLKLYVKRVFIMDDCKDLVPNWLRFVSGVVDSEDLPLNVSREILQDNRTMAGIRKHVVKKTLDALQKLADNKPEEYAKFWKEMGMVLKEGFYMNYEWLDELKSLLRFHSTTSGSDSLISLKDYVGGMLEDQKDIYYISGENLKTLETSPLLESFRAKGFEVLLMADHVDEFMMSGLLDYEGKQFKDISRGDAALDKTEDEEKVEKQQQEDFQKLCEALQTSLVETVETVRVTTRLQNSPCVLVNKEDAMNAHMERLMKQMGQDNMPVSKRILEINPQHAICKTLQAKAEAGEELGQWPTVLLGQALLAEGSPLPDANGYVQAVNELLS